MAALAGGQNFASETFLTCDTSVPGGYESEENANEEEEQSFIKSLDLIICLKRQQGSTCESLDL